MILDLGNLDKLPPQQRKQFEQLIEQHPYLKSKMETAREINTAPKVEPKTETKKEAPAAVNPAEAFQKRTFDDGALDYDAMRPESSTVYQPIKQKPEDRPTIKIDAQEHSFTEMVPQEENGPKEEPKVEQKKEQKISKDQTFSPEGKEHPILTKMKTLLGMKTADVPPVYVKVGSVEYGMRQLGRDKMVFANSMALRGSFDDNQYRANIEAAIVATAITHIDRVPKEIVFQIPDEEEDLAGVKRKYTFDQQKERASELLYRFLKDAPNEVTNTLASMYGQEFPTLDLVEPGKQFNFCPEASCQYKYLLEDGQKAYCPHHGRLLVAERDLPNPS